MGKLVVRVQSIALALGAPGLLLVTFLDSSFIPLPQLADLLLVWMVVQHKNRMVLYASSAVVGSVAGCLTLYWAGRKGGEALLESRFSSAAIDRTRATIRRHGVVSVLVMCLLPPPAPFKIFVILAGVAGIGTTQFAAAIALGRAIRYFTEGVLAVEFGDQAIEYIRSNGRMVSVAMVVLILAGVAGYVVWSKARERSGR